MNSLSISDLVQGILPWRTKSKGVALLFSYFDESGTHATSKVVLICGIVAKAKSFAGLEADWSALLAKHGLAKFHATDCENGNKEFKNWERDKREHISSQFTDLICKHKPHVVNSVLPTEKWDKTKWKESHFPNPYAVCFYHCMQQLQKWSIGALEGEEIGLVFGEQNELEPPAQKLYELYRSNRELGAPLASLTFVPMRKFCALQAADLIAFEVYQHAKKQLAQKEPKLRKNYQKMVDAGIGAIGADYDASLFASLLYPDQSNPSSPAK